MLARQGGNLSVVNTLIVLPDAIGDDLKEFSGKIDRTAVREMPAVRQVHAQDGVSRLELREIGGHISLGPGVRLNIDVLGTE